MWNWNNFYKGIFLFLWVFTCAEGHAQMGIGTTSPNSAAELDISSTSKGLLIPRMTEAQLRAISSPATGLKVYNTNTNSVYYFNGSDWLSVLNSYKVYEDGGVDVQFDNLIVQIPSSSNRSLQLKTVSGSITMSGSSINLYLTASAATGGSAGSIDGFTRQSSTLTTSYQYWQSSIDFGLHGSSQTIYVLDETNGRSYRILCIIGNGYLDNFFEIERLR
jgi:hypothetical protein